MNNFSLFSLFRIAVKNILILLLSAVVFAAAAYSYCEYIAKPEYSASGSVLVTNGAILNNYNTDNINNSDIVASVNLADTTVDILRTNGIYKLLSEKLEYKYSYLNLHNRTSIKKRSNYSLFIDVNFTSADPNEAKAVINEFLELVPNYVNEFIPNTAVVSTSVADTASKTYPRTITTTFIAAIIGAGITFLVLFIIDSFDTLIKSEDDVKEHFDIPILGVIPDFTRANSGKYKTYNYYKGGSNYEKTKVPKHY